MPILEQVAKYSVQVGQSNVVPWNAMIRLTLVSGGKVSILFPDVPPADFVTFSGDTTTVQMPRSEYEHVYHLLQTESPVFFTALNLFGLMTAMLSTDPETIGEGFADADMLEFLKSRASQRSSPAKGDGGRAGGGR